MLLLLDVISIFLKNHLKLLVIVVFLFLTGFASTFTTMWDRFYTTVSAYVDIKKMETKFYDMKNEAEGLFNKFKK